MSNSTNQNSSHKTGQINNAEAKGLLHDKNIKLVKKYLNKLPEHCDKVSNESLKKVFDFAKSYKVISSRNAGHIEINLN